MPPAAEPQPLEPLELPPEEPARETPLASAPTSPPAPVLAPVPAPLPAPEPTPMDNLLAVAELELELATGSSPAQTYSFREEARDDMSFSLGEPKPADDLFFDRKAGSDRVAEDDLAAHKELFESISEAHYLPELGGPHDEALLESLVEKGCEDNQILGQALDKLAHLVAGAEYAEEEEDMLLSGAPVADIIDRLESLESGGRSMTAAQGLLTLHRHHPQPPALDAFLPPDEFAADNSEQCALEPLETPATEMPKTTEVNHLDYEQNAEKRLQSDVDTAVLFSQPVPDLHDTYERDEFEENLRVPHTSPAIPEVTLPAPVHTSDTEELVRAEEITQEEMTSEDGQDKRDAIDLKPDVEVLAKVTENPEAPKDLSIMYIEDDGEPRDLTVPRRMATPAPLPSPRRIEIPRAPSRESDAMQSPQPSGIPAISSPEVFQAPASKNSTRAQSILDAMFRSASPKMYLTSEVSITKQQCEPLNLGKHRKSASPTVSSCSEEKSSKTYGEPLEKRQKRNSMDDLYQITRLLTDKKKKEEKTLSKKELESLPSLKQFQSLKANKNFNIPDPLLIPKDRFAAIQNNPGKEIPALLVDRPELRYYDDLDEERDRDIIVISVKEFEEILVAKDYVQRRVSSSKAEPAIEHGERGSDPTPPTTPVHPEPHTTKPSSQPKPIPSMGALAEDIDAATSATLAPMLWAQYAQQQMEAVAACSQNAEFLKALNASGYGGANYADLSQMLMSHPSRLVNPAGFPMMPHMDYERMQLVLWQEMMLQKMQTQRRKSTSAEAQMKEAAAKSSEFQSPYVHSTNKGYGGRAHSSARTSPIANNYAGRSAGASMQHPFLGGMYGGLGARHAGQPLLPGLSVPYFPAPSGQRSPRAHKSPTPPSPSYAAYPGSFAPPARPNEAAPRAPAAPDAARPRISVKKVDELRRRRDDAEVGSTTPLGEPPLLPSDSSVPLWHPLFGNQKNYTSPWSWTTVTATGD